jgi:hypothetical protein
MRSSSGPAASRMSDPLVKPSRVWMVALFGDGAEDLEFDTVLGPSRGPLHSDEVIRSQTGTMTPSPRSASSGRTQVVSPERLAGPVA